MKKVRKKALLTARSSITAMSKINKVYILVVNDLITKILILLLNTNSSDSEIKAAANELNDFLNSNKDQ